jgi:hypothetical protein
MSKLEQIEAEIKHLPADEVSTLAVWIAEYRAQLWDQQIARDARPGGPLDRLARDAIEDFKAGRTKPLP